MSEPSASDFPDPVTVHTVPIHPIEGEGTPGLGSGVFLKLADEFFLLSARHVVEPKLDGKPIGIRVTGKLHGSVDLAGSQIHVTTGADDVAIVRVSQESARQLIDTGYEPATSAVLRPPPPGPGTFAFCGYPREVVRPLEKGAEIRYLLLAGIEPSAPSAAFAEYHEQHHATFTWPNDRSLSVKDQDGQLRANVDPTGMSGGGIWWHPSMNDGGLVPDLYLIGIENAWDAVDKLRVTRIHRVLQFLFQNAPSLTPIRDIVVSRSFVPLPGVIPAKK